MTSITNILENAVIGNNADVLDQIHLASKNIAVYRRNMDTLRPGLQQIAMELIGFEACGSISEIEFSLSEYFTKTLPEYLNLMHDVLHLLRRFEQLTEVSSFRLSLGKVCTTMCPRFHADNNQLRMLCTYLGPGTLWLPNHAANRKAYLNGKGNVNILSDENLVQQANSGDVIILKGALYPGGTPILHRSPNIESPVDERILLTIDPNESISPRNK